jgi:hypothetical protein
MLSTTTFSPRPPPLSHYQVRQLHPTTIMLYITAIVAFVAAVAATPVPAKLCPEGLYSNPQCCATDVLGAVGLNCAVRMCS